MTMTADEQEQAAARIDERLRLLEADGFRDTALLSLMVEHARTYDQLVRGTPPERLKELSCRYAGLRKFSALLTRVASLVATGRISA